MKPKEMIESGILMEINRQILHPMGLQLAVADDIAKDEWTICDELIETDDPRGFTYEFTAEDRAKRIAFLQRFNIRRKAREAMLDGHCIQPIPLGEAGDSAVFQAIFGETPGELSQDRLRTAAEDSDA